MARKFLDKILRILGSFGLATVVLIFLLIMTLLGTFEQVEHGLFASQRKYFESFVIWSVDLGGNHLPILLPGGALLISLLFINMILGAVSRMHMKPRRIGILIAHLSILFLLVAAFVSFLFKEEGNLALYEGQTSDEFQSYHDSVIEIERIQPPPPDGKRRVLVIPGRQYQDLSEGRARTFTSKELPFDLSVMHYMEHSDVRRATERDPKPMVVDGFVLQEKAPVSPETRKALEHEQRLDGAYVKAVEKKAGQEHAGIIWRAEAAPFAFKVGDETYSISITRRRWRLPFAVRLDKFERETHAGTEQARKFTSYVTKITKTGKPSEEKIHEEKKIITMNAPLRDHGNVLFQASFSQDEGRSGVMTRSVFAVVRNPSDQWPLWALISAGIGLLIHMSGQLTRFLSRSRSKKEAVAAV